MDNTIQSKGSNSQTMYNLHTKRTLPRDVIKWMQSLDLSYSVKDYRKDMSNGFLIGQIISRYEPGRIPMHAFQNSHNKARRDNNWIQLQLFFNKYSLRSIQIAEDQYSKIKNNSDPKSDHLYNFVCRLYSICTKKSIPENPPILDLPPTQTNNPNLTTSYLLRDDGLQKLQNSGLQSNASNLNNSGYTEKNQDRVPTRKIAPNLDTSNMVDATGVGIKAEGRKLTSKRKSWGFDQKQQSNYSEENAQNDKLIFDYLHEIMEQCLPSQDPSIRQILFPDNTKYSPTQILKRNIATVDPQYLKNFITQLHLSIEQLTPIILRQINEIWKFFVYFIRLLKGLQQGSQQFTLLIELLSDFSKNCHIKQPKRIGKVFHDSLILIIINQVKSANYWRKKEKIMSLIYDFSGRQLQEKKSVLSRLKDQIGSNNPLYIQWLSVLIKEQTQYQQIPQSGLIDDYIYYAQQYMTSTSLISRTAALKILQQISKRSCNLIQQYFMTKSQNLKHSQGDPQQIYLIINIFYNILKQTINQKEYQTLIKGVGSNNLVKAYNPDNQKNAQQLKRKVNVISQTIQSLSQNSANNIVRQLCAKKSINYISQSKAMMFIFLDYIAGIPSKQLFFSGQTTEHQFKSLNCLSEPINLSIITEYSNEILTEIISLKTNQQYSIESFMHLINMCLSDLNIKKINMQFWEDVSMHIVKTYTKLLTQIQYCKNALEGLLKIFNVYFNYDMKIRQIGQWLAESISSFHKTQKQVQASEQSQNQTIKQQFAYIQTTIKELDNWLNQEYSKTKSEVIRFVVIQISDLLEEMGTQKVIALKK